jgi:hypothetical protein
MIVTMDASISIWFNFTTAISGEFYFLIIKVLLKISYISTVVVYFLNSEI